MLHMSRFPAALEDPRVGTILVLGGCCNCFWASVCEVVLNRVIGQQRHAVYRAEGVVSGL